MILHNLAIKFLFSCGLLLFCCLLAKADSDESSQPQPLAIDTQMPAFELADFRGRAWSSQDFADKEILAVIFFGTECPLVRLYAPRLKEIQDELGGDGVQLVGINSCRQDSLAEIGHFARVTNIEFPLLKDPGNKVADAFGASRTPEIFLFNSERANFVIAVESTTSTPTGDNVRKSNANTCSTRSRKYEPTKLQSRRRPAR